MTVVAGTGACACLTCWRLRGVADQWLGIKITVGGGPDLGCMAVRVFEMLA